MNKKEERIGCVNYNNQGCLMKCVEYYNCCNIIVEFQDNYKTRINTDWRHFNNGDIQNPYYPWVCNIGMTGNKYLCAINGKNIKEYETWYNMLKRCFNEKEKKKYPTYKDVTCCNEWLLYENFYEWLHSQENFNKWKTLDKSALDKDIIHKGNKIYSPENCCLVPQYVNTLFIKNNNFRGEYPIGVTFNKSKNKFEARVSMINNNKQYLKSLGTYNTPEEAFYAYKNEKEKYIKQVAEKEYNNGNITKKCYDAMMEYQVEITD